MIHLDRFGYPFWFKPYPKIFGCGEQGKGSLCCNAYQGHGATYYNIAPIYQKGKKNNALTRYITVFSGKGNKKKKNHKFAFSITMAIFLVASVAIFASVVPKNAFA